ncbi:MAG: T9SS type A sorting domain-containing protein [Chitinophagales bacterium]|nr:T9SS type A sorting domain-containing protein [Chitinophagales bacterium]
MKQYLRVLALAVVLFATTAIKAQVQVRYLDEVFANVTVDTSVVYAQNYEYYTNFNTLVPLKMDVYRPAGDTATNRPVVLLSHNGSFLPENLTAALLNFCFKNRKDSSLVELCHRFARRGYVAISFSYRLGWNALASDQETRAKTIIQAVYRGMQDAKSLVRYLKDDYANNSNQWGIDTGKIVIGGTNSGAYIALAAGALNDTSEINAPKFVGTGGAFIDQDTLGDFDGFGGTINHDNYPGISSKFQCVLALGGAVGDTSWIQAGEPPVLGFHGVNETLTPYNTNIVVTSTGQPVVEVSGAGDYMPYVEALGNNAAFSPNNFADGPPNRQGGVSTVPVQGLYPFYGVSFEPWNWYSCTMPINPNASKTRAMAYIDTIMGYAAPRLYKLLINPSYTGPSSIHEVKGTIEMQLFPNPTNTELNIMANTLQRPVSEVRMFDLTGKLVKQVNNINGYNHTIYVGDLTTGVYQVFVKLTDGTYATRKVSVER